VQRGIEEDIDLIEKINGIPLKKVLVIAHKYKVLGNAWRKQAFKSVGIRFYLHLRWEKIRGDQSSNHAHAFCLTRCCDEPPNAWQPDYDSIHSHQVHV
jgi:hypothetical protein